jgi:hypothetical protein
VKPLDSFQAFYRTRTFITAFTGGYWIKKFQLQEGIILIYNRSIVQYSHSTIPMKLKTLVHQSRKFFHTVLKSVYIFDISEMLSSYIQTCKIFLISLRL